MHVYARVLSAEKKFILILMLTASEEKVRICVETLLRAKRVNLILRDLARLSCKRFMKIASCDIMSK